MIVEVTDGLPYCFGVGNGVHVSEVDYIIATDAINPSVAARFVEPLGQWRRYRPDLADKMRGELDRILSQPNLSKNVLELATKALD